ncbi:NAD(P)/FAD-dependent oxidoreductase [Parathalassolituus penaei]|uniref:NAD(P)/FAD-dependent oxidoreductase n=1 Tax=Parathalassolituus penaei TaxID=2997323 RepID=A0A9X3EEE3_9GAMM|nr:NAD(P)/FAD-dependent oxidoreductase [Parathalassolituus penaei]MCY0965284.1 NAD(P)/FAD-dependent oxidoreductase [Parathalassolituus penaei]
MSKDQQRIVIVGGGAGGLELATCLGHKLGRKGKASIKLIDRNRTHIWKPLLHEVASGTLDTGTQSVSYFAHGARHGYQFELGQLMDVDVVNKTITLASRHNSNPDSPRSTRVVEYDQLILGIGSISNDFGVPGIQQHCFMLDSLKQAERFHTTLIDRFTEIHQDHSGERLRIAIVGAGATGVELSAELYKVTELLTVYGMAGMSQRQLEVNLIEAGPRVLPALPERISTTVSHELRELGVNIRTSVAVVAADEKGLQTKEGERIDADLMVWAAGVKAPDVVRNIKGLDLTRSNQIRVNDYLQATSPEGYVIKDLWIIGDCAAFTGADGRQVPPRAQSAHQMASNVYANIMNLRNGKPLKGFEYHDHGSLVSLSSYSAVGTLMGNLTRKSMFVEGNMARLFYISLYRMHQLAIHGKVRGALIVAADWLSKAVKPKMKLH